MARKREIALHFLSVKLFFFIYLQIISGVKWERIKFVCFCPIFDYNLSFKTYNFKYLSKYTN